MLDEPSVLDPIRDSSGALQRGTRHEHIPGDSVYFFYSQKKLQELRCGELALVMFDIELSWYATQTYSDC